MDSYYFSCKGLTVGYRNHPVIKDISLELHRGEIMTLIGPNGAGKSTILKTIAKQLDRITGEIFLGQEEWKQISPKALSQKLSVVFTERLHAEMMTCEDIVAMGRYPYTGHFGILSEKDREAVENALHLVHIEELRDCNYNQLSDGQRQRVLLAKALCQEPEVLLLDEPTSFLDMKHKLEFLSILQKLAREKQLTVIMSLHELDLAERISDKILCVKGDYVEKIGEPQEIFANGYISELFDIRIGSFDELSDDVELDAPKGMASVFVLAGNGTGRATYRSLQRQGIPFITGILYENDIDYPVAKALAAEVIHIKAFSSIEAQDVENAKKAIHSCEKFICCIDNLGIWDDVRQQLIDYAQEINLEVITL